jgi:hypothetical protein
MAVLVIDSLRVVGRGTGTTVAVQTESGVIIELPDGSIVDPSMVAYISAEMLHLGWRHCRLIYYASGEACWNNGRCSSRMDFVF